ncbi:MAG: phage portal protein [Clostridiaceae bacterium]|jgi:hypothetical protein|nr:phage portal protein [Clostridiaceae bacterium]
MNNFENTIEDAYDQPSFKFDFIYQNMPSVDFAYMRHINGTLRSAYELKRTWLLAANGYVPEWHSSYIPTKLANSAISQINRKIFSGGLLAAKNTADGDADKLAWLRNEFLENICPDFSDKMRRLSWFALASGAAALAVNIGQDGNIMLDAVREDKYFPIFVNGKLKGIRMFKQVYGDVSDKSENTAYFLEDYRYFDANGKAYSKLRVFGSRTVISGYAEPGGEDLQYRDLPETVAAMLGSELGRRLGKSVAIPFGGGCDLGVRILNNTEFSSYYDISGYGDSIIAPVLELLFEYDKLFTTMSNDIALGRGMVLIPDGMSSMGMGTKKGGYLSDETGDAGGKYQRPWNMFLNSKIFKKWRSLRPEEQKPDSIQFAMRIEEHKSGLRELRSEIYNGMGVNPAAIDPSLDDRTAAKTATQVMAEEQNLLTFIEAKREKIARVANWVIDIVLEFYFKMKTNDIYVKFSNSGIANKLFLSQMAVQEYKSGIRSRKKAVEMINSDSAQTAIDEEIEQIIKENQEKNQEQNSRKQSGDTDNENLDNSNNFAGGEEP